MNREKLKRRMQKFINYYHLYRAALASTYYHFPSRKLKVIGVTGTDGKTTTTHLIYHILKSNGKKVSMLSTVYAKIGDKEYDTGLHMTTPDAVLVQKLLRQAVEHGDEYFVLETTSHAFDQNRNWGVHYKVSVITNITPEHLDYHRTYENYLRTKAKILLRSDMTFINRDDRSFEKLEAFARLHNAKYRTYGLMNMSDVQKDINNELKLELAQYNNYNYLAAYGVCISLGLSDNEILHAMKTYLLPKGRMDMVYDKDFKVIVDFAHTANAFLQLLSFLRPLTKGRIIHVFGAAGLRDAQKRPFMGEISSRYADVIIVTEEDYRTEDPAHIVEEVVKGMKEHDFTSAQPEELSKKSEKVYAIILNREAAIRKAISIAKKGDVVVCTGKSHEKSLARGNTEYPWDEYKAVKVALSTV